MTNKSKLQKQYALPRWYKIAVIGLILTITISLIASIGYLLYWRSGWPSFQAAVQECNGKPPIQTNSFMARTYILPTDKNYRIPAGTVYFCTEADAKAAGYRHTVLGDS